jgi:hypothetical protein
MIFDEIDPLYEMSWFDSDDTGLPIGLSIWLRADPMDHGHSRYRLKVKKNNIPAGIFLISSQPIQVKQLRQKLSPKEVKAIQEFIQDNLSILINHIDSKISSAKCGMDIQKNRGELGINGQMKNYTG